MNGLERVLTAIRIQEPDRVPHFEGLIAKQVRDALLPNASMEKFVEYMDLDAVVIFDKTNWKYESIDARHVRDQWGGIVLLTDTDLGHPMEGALKSGSDLDKYTAPDPNEEWRYEPIKRMVAKFKGERAIIAHVTDVFDVAKESLLGDIKYFTAMRRDSELVDRVNQVVLDYHLPYIRNCIDLGADIVFVTGDWAMTTGPMASRELTKRFIAPPFAKIAEYCHSRGIPCLKHSDGNLWPIWDIIVDAGADGLHPIDPMGGMDMAEAKRVFGDKICLMGNVSCAYSLVSGTPDEVREETREVIRKAGRGGGLIVMSSNSIHSGVKPENYKAMVDTIHEWGKYPLDWINA